MNAMYEHRINLTSECQSKVVECFENFSGKDNAESQDEFYYYEEISKKKLSHQ